MLALERILLPMSIYSELQVLWATFQSFLPGIAVFGERMEE